MRPLRLLLAGITTLSLVASPTLAVTAQEDGQEPATATYVTGVAVPTPEGNTSTAEGDRLVGEMDWSDPRLPPRMVAQFSAEGVQGIHPDGSGMTARMAVVMRLEGLEGSWSGTGHILAWTLVPESGDESQETRTELLILDGEGEYEGLSAWLMGTTVGADVPTYEGFIFESALTMPDPIEPTAE